MKSLLTLLFAFVLNEYSFCQDSFFVINAGAKVNDVIPAKASYHYKDFVRGKVVFRDGNVSEGKLNYNKLMDEMHFINERGDTLAIDNEPTISYVSIDKDTFYFDRGYFMLIQSNQSIKLCVKQGFRFGDRKRKAAYGLESSTSSVSSYSSFNDGRIVRPLEVNEQTTLYKFADYYFADKYNRFVLANKNALIEILPECKKQIKEFYKTDKIDFQNKNEIEKLFEFMDGSCNKRQ